MSTSAENNKALIDLQKKLLNKVKKYRMKKKNNKNWTYLKPFFKESKLFS